MHRPEPSSAEERLAVLEERVRVLELRMSSARPRRAVPYYLRASCLDGHREADGAASRCPTWSGRE